MADGDTEVEGKKKSPLLKIILLVVVLLIVLAGAVGATLYFTGFFDKKDEAAAEQALKDAEKAAAGAKDPAKEAPKPVAKPTPEIQRFEFSYLELERELLANLTNSRKVMQVQMAFMTRYDERVFKNVKKHEFALRSVALDVMRQTTDADLDKPDFRKNLAEKLRTELNAKLESLEDFGGIEEVYFTSFVIQ